MRQWRRLLSLLLLGNARLRPHCAGRYLRSRLPADRRSAALWRADATEEDAPDRVDRTLRGRLSALRARSTHRLSVPISWMIAPRLRARYWREKGLKSDIISGPNFEEASKAAACYVRFTST